MLCLCHGSQFDAYPILAEFCLLRCDVNPVQTRSIFAENLALDLQGQIDATYMAGAGVTKVTSASAAV